MLFQARSAILHEIGAEPRSRPLSGALRRWIAGAGRDDIEEEPAKVRDCWPENPLLGLDNVLITHAAYYSEEAIGTVRRFAAEEVVRVLSGQPPLSPVNADGLVEAHWSRSP